MESSLELPPSASSLRRRSVCRRGPRAPRLAGSFEPGLAASRRGRLRVIYESPFRALSLSASPLRGRGFCRGGPRAPRLAGSFEPGLAACRRGRLRVLHGEHSRALTAGPFVARPILLPLGPASPAASWPCGPDLAFLAAVALESFVEASSRSGLRVIFLFFRSVLPVSSHPQPDLGDF